VSGLCTRIPDVTVVKGIREPHVTIEEPRRVREPDVDAGSGGQPSAGQNNSNAMSRNNNATQQRGAGLPNQNVGAGQQNDPRGNQPATTGQGGDRS
jgi:hypothetical protein